MTSPIQTHPLLAAFRGAGVDVLVNAKQPNGLWLSEVADLAGLARRPDVAAGLGVRYTLQRSLINGWPTPQTSPSPWQVTQVWRAAADGMLGMVVVQATADAPGVAVLGRVALGPGAVEAPTDRRACWQCGPLQVKFLRAIQEKEVTPLGSTRPVRVDVRIIAATNRNLEEAVRDGIFRTDLFYRLNVVPIHLPPLRERREDIPLLVERFIAEFSRAYGVEPKRVTPEAMNRILEYDWPGNIRELQNAIERAFALSSEPEITLTDLPPAVLRGEDTVRNKDTVGGVLPLEEVERQSIVAALQRSGGNKNKAARLLGIDRQRLYRKIEKYGLAS